MVGVAMLALCFAGALHVGLAIAFAILLVLSWPLERTRWQLSERVGLMLVLLSLPLFYLDWTYLGSDLRLLETGETRTNALVGAITHLIVFLSVIKLLQIKSDRDWVFIYLISFFEMLLAAGLTFSPVFLILLSAYFVCALSTDGVGRRQLASRGATDETPAADLESASRGFDSLRAHSESA